MQVLNSLFPIFAVIALGMALRCCGFLTQEITQGFNRFAYYFALPMFLFYKLGSAPVEASAISAYVATLLVATLATATAAWLACKPIGISFDSRGAFIQACFRGNLAFIGYPLITFSIFDLSLGQRSEIDGAILVAITPTVIVYNILSVAVLAIFNKETESGFSWGHVIKNIGSNPLLLASVAGVVFQIAGLTIPTAVERTCSVVGASAFPMALLGIGSQLTWIWMSEKKPGLVSDGKTLAHHLPLFSSVIKSVFCPLVGWGVGTAVGLTGVELKVILILCGVPPAVSGYVLADQMKGDSDLAASTVVVGTACSLVTLSVLLWLTG